MGRGQQFADFMNGYPETPDPDPDIVEKIYLDYISGTVLPDDDFDAWWVGCVPSEWLHVENIMVDIRHAVWLECGDAENFDYICDAVYAMGKKKNWKM